MATFITILIVLAAILMILIVLVQNSKGGGLASGFASSNQIMGVRKTTDFLEKATWSLAATIVVLSIVSAAFISRTGVETSEIQNTIQQEAAVELPNVGGDVPAVPAQAEETPANN